MYFVYHYGTVVNFNALFCLHPNLGVTTSSRNCFCAVWWVKNTSDDTNDRSYGN